MHDPVTHKKKPGPKPKAAEEYRLHRVSVYLTDDEYQSVSESLQLETNTHKFSLGRAMADHFRRAATHQGPAQLPAPALNIEAWQELARLASNINQLAKSANSGRVTGVNSGQLDAIYREIQALRSALVGA